MCQIEKNKSTNEQLQEVVHEENVNVNLGDENDDWSRAALHLASINGHLEIVKLLLESGANVHIKDKGDQTALHLASRNGHLEIVKLLLESGANVNIKDKNGQTALHYASRYHKSEVVNLLENWKMK